MYKRQSYVSVEFATEYLTSRDVVLPGGLEALLVRAMDFLNGIDDWIGDRTNAVQVLDWLRTGITNVGDNEIPLLLKNAQVELVTAIDQGIDIFPNRQAGEFVTEERVGPVQVKYSPYIGTDSAPVLGYVDRVLSRFRSPRYSSERA